MKQHLAFCTIVVCRSFSTLQFLVGQQGGGIWPVENLSVRLGMLVVVI